MYEQSYIYYNHLIKYKSEKLKLKQMAFDLIFGKIGREPYHMRVLSQILCMAITFHSNQLLYFTSHWLQKNITDRKLFSILSQKLIEEFFVFNIYSENYLIKQLPDLCASFCAHLIADVILLCMWKYHSYYLEKRHHTLELIASCLTKWIEDYPSLILFQFSSLKSSYDFNNTNYLLILIWWMCKVGFSINQTCSESSVSHMHSAIIKVLVQAPQIIPDHKIRQHLLEDSNLPANIHKDPQNLSEAVESRISIFDCLRLIHLNSKTLDFNGKGIEGLNQKLDKLLLILIVAFKNRCFPKTVSMVIKLKTESGNYAKTCYERNVELEHSSNKLSGIDEENLNLEEGEERSPCSAIIQEECKITPEQLAKGILAVNSNKKEMVIDNRGNLNDKSTVIKEPFADDNIKNFNNEDAPTKQIIMEEFDWMDIFTQYYSESNFNGDNRLYHILLSLKKS
ncbi:uncharacterized protein LOC135932021 [Gordionus sp. m RMFG-2023]|uniref:uncharacterized protein LOC135932021 n=1 Tax=Gordionus sp. m RMFG-2023 TaxID=3053472 RepID=UPI0031FC98C3